MIVYYILWLRFKVLIVNLRLFNFAGDLNTHHREWLGSVSFISNLSHAALDFASLSGCEQLFTGATHKSGNRLDLVLTNVPGIIEVNVFPPVGSSDHRLLSCTVSTAAHIPNVSFSRHVFLKLRADWDGIRNDIKDQLE